MSKEKDWKVYLHVSKLDGRMYCGITSQTIQQRWQYGMGYKNCTHFSRAIKKLGWDNFHHIVLMRGGTKEEAAELERTIVRICKLQDPNYGFNISDGGNVGNKISEEGIQRLHDTFFRSASPRSRKLVLFDYSTGKKLQTFDCMSDCAEFLNITISSLERHVKPDDPSFRKKYFVRYMDDVQDAEYLLNIDEIKEKYKYTGRALKINQYSLDGKYIATYRSIREVSAETGALSSEISACARRNPTGNHGKKSSGGYMWRYYAGDTSDIEPISRVNLISVEQIDIKTGDIIGTYGTISEAAKANGIQRSAIKNALTSKSHYGKGFYWKLIESNPNQPGE